MSDVSLRILVVANEGVRYASLHIGVSELGVEVDRSVEPVSQDSSTVVAPREFDKTAIIEELRVASIGCDTPPEGVDGRIQVAGLQMGETQVPE